MLDNIFQTAKKELETYRWMLLMIAITGVAMDCTISLLITPYPLVPHVSFWADGFLMYLHPRAVLYLFGAVFALMHLWFTSLLIAFTYRLYKLAEAPKKRQVLFLGHFFAVICVFNIIITDFVLFQYPSQEEVVRIIKEEIPEVMFLFKKPAFIYFVEADNYIFAQIGLTHTVIMIVCFVFAFLYVFWRIHATLSVSKNVMSKKTLMMHRKFIRALIVQMQLPMLFMTVPSIIVAVSIKFGSTENSGINYQFIANICLLCVCTHSPINTAAMYFFVVPFRRFIGLPSWCCSTVDITAYRKSTVSVQSNKV